MKAGEFAFDYKGGKTGTLAHPEVLACHETVDESISKLVSAKGLLEFGDQWLHKAYLFMKDSQSLWEDWISCLCKLLDKHTAEEDAQMLQELKYALIDAHGRYLNCQEDERAFRENPVLCVVRKVQLDWVWRQRNSTAPRRLKQLQATQVASCSFRGELKANQAQKARKKAQKAAKEEEDSAEDDDDEIRDTADTPHRLTEERVRKATVPELKALAAAHGQLPAGRSTFHKQDWLDHVLKLLGFT